MFKIKDNKIELEKEVTELDKFVLEIVHIIEKYTKYVIISGYVSIFFGRARGTEDVDMFIMGLPPEKFTEMYNEFVSQGYEFTIDNPEGLYNDYLKSGLAINVWKKDFPLLRMEIKLAKKRTQILAFTNKIEIQFDTHHLFFGSIESQIAYKRYIAKSPKDLEDARHLEVVFENLNQEDITFYKKEFESEFNG